HKHLGPSHLRVAAIRVRPGTGKLPVAAADPRAVPAKLPADVAAPQQFDLVAERLAGGNPPRLEPSFPRSIQAQPRAVARIVRHDETPDFAGAHLRYRGVDAGCDSAVDARRGNDRAELEEDRAALVKGIEEHGAALEQSAKAHGDDVSPFRHGSGAVGDFRVGASVRQLDGLVCIRWHGRESNYCEGVTSVHCSMQHRIATRKHPGCSNQEHVAHGWSTQRLRFSRRVDGVCK
ncbi:unnamed protein product, partial [Pelagomonas calceolata]